ncbi:hypothetical protein pb186bvf_021150 [Paramecium bursaria]
MIDFECLLMVQREILKYLKKHSQLPDQKIYTRLQKQDCNILIDFYIKAEFQLPASETIADKIDPLECLKSCSIFSLMLKELGLYLYILLVLSHHQRILNKEFDNRPQFVERANHFLITVFSKIQLKTNFELHETVTIDVYKQCLTHSYMIIQEKKKSKNFFEGWFLINLKFQQCVSNNMHDGFYIHFN